MHKSELWRAVQLPTAGPTSLAVALESPGPSRSGIRTFRFLVSLPLLDVDMQQLLKPGASSNDSENCFGECDLSSLLWKDIGIRLS
ncbi:unnamed protein product [Caretta caretta]